MEFKYVNFKFDLVAEPENKVFMMTTIPALAIELNQKLRSGVPSFVVLDETVRTLHSGFLYKSGLPYQNKLDSKAVQLLEGGFTARWMDNNTNLAKPEIKRKDEIIGPQVLTMDHLAIGFKVWLIPLTFSVIVFVLEIGKRPCRDFVRHVRDAIIARSVVLAFIDTRGNNKFTRSRAKAACEVSQTTTLPPIRAGTTLEVTQTTALPVCAGLCGGHHHIRARPVLEVAQTTLKLETLIEIEQEL